MFVFDAMSLKDHYAPSLPDLLTGALTTPGVKDIAVGAGMAVVGTALLVAAPEITLGVALGGAGTVGWGMGRFGLGLAESFSNENLNSDSRDMIGFISSPIGSAFMGLGGVYLSQEFQQGMARLAAILEGLEGIGHILDSPESLEKALSIIELFDQFTTDDQPDSSGPELNLTENNAEGEGDYDE